jgi:hypothetical protein
MLSGQGRQVWNGQILHSIGNFMTPKSTKVQKKRKIKHRKNTRSFTLMHNFQEISILKMWIILTVNLSPELGATCKKTKYFYHLVLGVTLERRPTRDNTTRWTAPSPSSRSFSDDSGSGRRDAMSSLLCRLGRIMSRVPTNIRKKKPDIKILS